MKRVVLAMASAAVLAAPLEAQLRAGLDGVLLTHREISRDRTARGVGLGPSLDVRRGKLHLDVSALRAHLSQDTASFDMTQVDVRVGYRIKSSIDLEIGMSRRWIAPAFAAQDVGLLSIGAYSEGRLSRVAVIWVRGAFMPLVKFGGGGKPGTSVAIGLGSSLTSPSGRWRYSVDFGLQRLDREVQGVPVPIQTSFVRLGASIGLRN